MSGTPKSADFDAFVASVEGASAASREEVDVPALLRLAKGERRAAEQLLMARVALDDWRAPSALAACKCRGAVMPMKRRLPRAGGRMKIAIAQALVALEALPRADEIVAEVLAKGEPESGLVALAAADEMRSELMTAALAWACVKHPVAAVRCGAAATLFYIAGLAQDPLAWSLRPIYLPLAADDEASRRAAFETICSIVGLPPNAVK